MTLDGATISGGTINNTGTLSVTTASQIENSTVNGGGTLSSTASGQTLTLDTVTLDGVTLARQLHRCQHRHHRQHRDAGRRHHLGRHHRRHRDAVGQTSSEIENSTVNGGGTLSAVATGQALTLDTVTLDGVTLAASSPMPARSPSTTP